MIPKSVSYSESESQKNVFGNLLESCSKNPLTGYFRTGCCETDSSDTGSHTVCAQVTSEFLAYSKKMGNDLSSATSFFPGLKANDRWCLCAGRWLEAYAAGCAPKVYLEATNLHCLELIPFEILEKFAVKA